eukprot:750996-Hanusia_phi.AAC.2
MKNKDRTLCFFKLSAPDTMLRYEAQAWSQYELRGGSLICYAGEGGKAAPARASRQCVVQVHGGAGSEESVHEDLGWLRTVLQPTAADNNRGGTSWSREGAKVDGLVRCLEQNRGGTMGRKN